jgi:hypothetical protein
MVVSPHLKGPPRLQAPCDELQKYFSLISSFVFGFVTRGWFTGCSLEENIYGHVFRIFWASKSTGLSSISLRERIFTAEVCGVIATAKNMPLIRGMTTQDHFKPTGDRKGEMHVLLASYGPPVRPFPAIIDLPV